MQVAPSPFSATHVCRRLLLGSRQDLAVHHGSVVTVYRLKGGMWHWRFAVPLTATPLALRFSGDALVVDTRAGWTMTYDGPPISAIISATVPEVPDASRSTAEAACGAAVVVRLNTATGDLRPLRPHVGKHMHALLRPGWAPLPFERRGGVTALTTCGAVAVIDHILVVYGALLVRMRAELCGRLPHIGDQLQLDALDPSVEDMHPRSRVLLGCAVKFRNPAPIYVLPRDILLRILAPFRVRRWQRCTSVQPRITNGIVNWRVRESWVELYSGRVRGAPP